MGITDADVDDIYALPRDLMVKYARSINGGPLGAGYLLGILPPDVGVITNATRIGRTALREYLLNEAGPAGDNRGSRPWALDSGAYQSYAQGVPTPPFPETVAFGLRGGADFVILNDVIGDYAATDSRAKTAAPYLDRVDILVPLHSIEAAKKANDQEVLRREIEELRALGYRKLGVPLTRLKAVYGAKIAPSVLEQVRQFWPGYLHVLGGGPESLATYRQYDVDSFDFGSLYFRTESTDVHPAQGGPPHVNERSFDFEKWNDFYRRLKGEEATLGAFA